jgi:hypothetical protein
MAQNRNRVRRVGAGQTARFEVHGTAAFTTTGVTKAVVVPLGRVEFFEAFYIGTPAASEAPLSANNTLSGTTGENDSAVVGTNGATSMTVTRPAGTTSGIKFFWRAIGY